jgi:hypothetical protein
MLSDKRSIVIDAVTPTDRLSETALDAVAGGRMKLLGPEIRPDANGGGGGGQPIDIQWANHPNYLPF